MSANVTYNMPQTTVEYLKSVLGEQAAHPQLAELLAAAHHVLAGGTVDVSIREAGESTRVAELNALRDAVMVQANRINNEAGTYMTAML